MPEEQDIHAHHNGYQSKHVKRNGGLSSHRFILVLAVLLRWAAPGGAGRKSAPMRQRSGMTPGRWVGSLALRMQVSWLSSRWAITVLAGLILLASLVVDVTRHVVPKAYAPVLVGLFLLAFMRFRPTILALVLVVMATVVLVIARWGVPLRPGEVATRAAQRFPALLGAHPYCFHDPYIQGLFGRTYDCYPHHVVPGKITDAEANSAMSFRASDTGIAPLGP